MQYRPNVANSKVSRPFSLETVVLIRILTGISSPGCFAIISRPLPFYHFIMQPPAPPTSAIKQKPPESFAAATAAPKLQIFRYFRFPIPAGVSAVGEIDVSPGGFPGRIFCRSPSFSNAKAGSLCAVSHLSPKKWPPERRQPFKPREKRQPFIKKFP